MKSETAEIQATQFVGLRSKMYSLHVPGLKKPNLMAKGIENVFCK